ncbi:carbamoyltransferase HypF [Methanocella sp. CWC-04]|uniref:Carbamoyltransferase n=1 Tax=Methanooceanicella nereidis TaxID=2052831 RepID=A0AAP2REQ8_9EURY|nr:carbamoyltransferase HypF [Methanocella sp. CWC-04]MCD1294715.1 carbamoyltransferase HypF [Methanocella sp. CWC-04]
MKKARFIVKGIVQGVGFRPFVHNLANTDHLLGYVKNLGTSVEIVVEGKEGDIEAFLSELKIGPKLSRVDSVDVTYLPYEGKYKDFSILKSSKTGFGGFIPPDTGICNQCIEDMRHNPHYKGYWATSCVDCGPRYAIMETLPYDRENTSMTDFPLCPECMKEFTDPGDRRYHAQTISCPHCGPKLTLFDKDRNVLEPPVDETIRLLKEGNILAIKGVGGFHLCCKMEETPKLRLRRNRPEQPFALMAPLKMIEEYACISDKERELLDSLKRPIILLRRKEGKVPEPVSPGLHTVGFMTPYTGFHHLLFSGIDEPLIMTSANLPSEPMVKDNEEAFRRLAGIADHYLVHDRRILNRCDDSVLRVNDGRMFFARMARGYAPTSFVMKEKAPKSILAMGPELNSTISIYKDDLCYVSHHLGNINNPLSLEFLRETVDRLLGMTQVVPEVIACDMHPSFLSTRLGKELAEKFGSEIITVQHHRAHIGSLVVEGADLDDVVGVAMDGVGFGEDGTVWGGELFLGDGHPAGLLPVPMPGGDLATKFPLRMVAGILYGEIEDSRLKEILTANMSDVETNVVMRQVETGLNVAHSSSAGRVLDAIAAALGICYRRTYEGEPAMKLESAAFKGDASRVKLSCGTVTVSGRKMVDSRSLLRSVVEALDEGKDRFDIAASAQNTLAKAFAEQACIEARGSGVSTVGFSGGVAINAAIGKTIRDEVEANGLKFVTNHKVPCGDGGVSFGQAVLACRRLRL